MFHLVPSWIAAFAVVAVSGAAMADDIAKRTEGARNAVKSLSGTLGQELAQAMEAGGPTKAIEVCNEKAPAIAAEISRKEGWWVARTSLKLRNRANAPDAWEIAVLEEFEVRKAAGENPAELEHGEIVNVDGKKQFRYMKAIPTAERPCLTCHGGQIAPAVTAVLDRRYPGDQARGFKAGDIRGAFTITQPMN